MAVSVINKDKKASAEIIDHIDGEPFPITSSLEEKGITTITKENLEVFEARNLDFIATLSKDGSLHVTPVGQIWKMV
jgi:hypothetical protein